MQGILALAGGLAVLVVSILGYIKKGKPAATGGDLAVVSAVFADKATAEALIEALECLGRRIEFDFTEESARTRRCVEENTRALRDLGESIRHAGMGSSPTDLLNLIDRLRAIK